MRIAKLLPFLILILITLFSCKNDNKNNGNKNDTTETNQINKSDELSLNAQLVLNKSENLKCGDILSVNLKTSDNLNADSIILFIDQKRLTDVIVFNEDYTIDTKDYNVGNHIVGIRVYHKNKSKIFNQKFLLLSDIVPKNLTYKVVNTYNHDPNAYTQGLCFDNDILYEATGLETKSTLRRVNLKTGVVEYSVTIPSDYFGEGITVFGNNIYQITWRNHVGFIYEKENFQKIAEFNFSTEGWGLTTDDKHIFMSDGTNRIFELEPSTLSLIKEIDVYDNIGPIYYLNELEYIDGLIYANVYTKDFIVTIDPKSGKVISKIDFSDILPNSLLTENTDVLNGIAYNKKTHKIYITGKNWPKLYEVIIINK